MFKETPKPSRKKHYFRHDKQDETITQANLNDWSMIANMAFCDHFAPPCVHDVQHANEACQEEIGATIMHPKDSTRQHNQSS